MNDYTEIPEDVIAKAEEHADKKMETPGLGVTPTTWAGVTEEEVRDRYVTGFIGEYLFAEWVVGTLAFVTVEDMNEIHGYKHPWDFTVNGVKVDVKATAAGHAEIEVGKRERVEEPDVYVKVELTDDRTKGRVRGFVETTNLISYRHRAAVGGKEGYRVGPTKDDYRPADEFDYVIA